MDQDLPDRLIELRDATERIADEIIGPRADEVDRSAAWPAEAMQALSGAGLMGLVAPRSAGGEEQGMVGLVALIEAIGRACASTAMCYGMHCVGTAVIAAKATPYQRRRYLEPIAAGEHVTTLALSESGPGSNFYVTETTLRRDGDAYLVDGTKQFVTSGSHADSYVVSTIASDPHARAGEFSCLIVDAADLEGAWLAPWEGFGMRGNSSRGVRLEGVRVPRGNLLGEEGDQDWYVFEIVTPYFVAAVSATYLGIARSALDLATEHLRTRRFSHSGETLAALPGLQQELADLWAAVQRTRCFVYDAARRADAGHADALPWIFMSKVLAADTVVGVTNAAMTLCGGSAYRQNAALARLLRDARASHVMAPTSHILRQWTGRALLGMPLL
jgi:isovaleryl-CoA dehydrogenase